MLAMPPLPSPSLSDDVKMTAAATACDAAVDISFMDNSGGGNLFDYIDFGSCESFLGFDVVDDGDMMPDLEVDVVVDSSDLLADFSAASGGAADQKQTAAAAVDEGTASGITTDQEDSAGAGSVPSSVSAEEDSKQKPTPSKSSGKRPTTTFKSSHHGKKKGKVDWTPELHRRFVQAVEQLGIDKAVPSRILELMGVDYLTRHNIASHLQKYRSHRKHMMVREAEAAGWNQRRQVYVPGWTTSSCGGAPAGKRVDMVNRSPMQLPPAIGLPQGQYPIHPPSFRPVVHVWGHPTMPRRPPPAHVWPQHLLPAHCPAPPWAMELPPLPPSDPTYWHHTYQMATQAAGAPCFAQPLPATSLPAPPLPGLLPRPAAAYRMVPTPAITKHAGLQAPVAVVSADLIQPAEDKIIDAAVQDVLAQPWLPLPLGLKPPSMESVMVELQKQGVCKVPPASVRINGDHQGEPMDAKPVDMSKL